VTGLPRPELESTTTRTAGGLDFTVIGGKRQGHEVLQSLRVEPGAKHPAWKPQSIADEIKFSLQVTNEELFSIKNQILMTFGVSGLILILSWIVYII
jgi:hypothetical protein